MMEFGARRIQLADYSLCILMVNVVPNLENQVLGLILLKGNVDLVPSVLTYGGR
jgi:hypothetical protein